MYSILPTPSSSSMILSKEYRDFCVEFIYVVVLLNLVALNPVAEQVIHCMDSVGDRMALFEISVCRGNTMSTIVILVVIRIIESIIKPVNTKYQSIVRDTLDGFRFCTNEFFEIVSSELSEMRLTLVRRSTNKKNKEVMIYKNFSGL